MKRDSFPSFWISIIPIIVLLASIFYIITTQGALSVSQYSQPILLFSALTSWTLSFCFNKRGKRAIITGLYKSWKQTLPAIPILLLIALVSTTWMLGGIVPTFIHYGLSFLSPKIFLFLACIICGLISVFTGSSWTTCATIGVAFIGIGSAMGYNLGWVAGAVISGAYFGDKISPLSDTTVLASSSSGVNLLKHVRFLMTTTIPSMTIALIVFLYVGLTATEIENNNNEQLLSRLNEVFYISPWLMIAPIITCTLIIARVNVNLTLAISSIFGLTSMILLQNNLLSTLMYGSDTSYFGLICKILLSETTLHTGNETLDSLTATGGIEGMLNTVYLVLSASIFAGAMLGTGMISSIISHGLKKLHGKTRIVSATVTSGLFLNASTGDQYLSIIIGSNLYKTLYRRNRLEAKVLSRSLEDSISVTSVLIPWNSCGLTQSSVLGVSTLTYLPYCIFNYLSPIMSIIMTAIGYKIKSYSNSPNDKNI